MRNLIKLIVVALSANILSILLYSYLMTLEGESGEAWFVGLFCVPAIWITSIILAIIFSYRNRRSYFKKNTFLWSILLIIFCTPIPIGFIDYKFSKSDTYGAESDIITGSNFSLKHEEWVYSSNNKMAVNKYYRIKGDSEDTSQYKRDSIWTYLNPSGDTVKIEKYNNGKLISIIKKKSKP